jgi:hypothetical protein
LELDLNSVNLNSEPLKVSEHPFIGFLLFYNENAEIGNNAETVLVDWFENKLCKGNIAQNRSIFKNYIVSKQKSDQILIEALKTLPDSLTSTENLSLHFLSFWYDSSIRTFYLYSVGLFDFYLFNGTASGSPIAPLQNRSTLITTKDLRTPNISIPEKTFHLVFENGLSSNGFFVYCGLPLEKTHPIHASPLLSRAFYRLKRDSGNESRREVEERIKKAFSKSPNIDVLDAFYYILGYIPV